MFHTQIFGTNGITVLCSFLLATANCGNSSETPNPGTVADSSTIRGNRYCEIILVFLSGSAPTAQVWGTQGLNDCPADAWATIDSATIQTETGATAVVINGPRHWLIDGATAKLPEVPHRKFGKLEMQQLASIKLSPGMTTATPYTERTVLRDSTFSYQAGAEVYELIAPSGVVYVMQSFAKIVDANLSENQLPGLGARLALPKDWKYQTRKLRSAVSVHTPGEAVVIQDELQNSYSKYVPSE